MAKLTPKGKVFSVDELINFGKINSYGVYNNAVLMALYDLKRLQVENAALKEEIKELNSEGENEPTEADSAE